MKNFLKISAVAAAMVASATFASADTFTFVSGVSAVTYVGYSSTVGDPTNLSGITGVSGGGTSAVVVSPNGVWAAPVTGSSWISNSVNNGPGGSASVANSIPNGDYIYSTTLNGAVGGAYNLSLTEMADDTVAVYLNGVLLPGLSAANVGADNMCSVNDPTCTRPYSVNEGVTLAAGTNTFTFVVEQTGLVSEGLDFSGTVSSVPEPSTLMLLGTGLMGSAGALFRRMRS